MPGTIGQVPKDRPQFDGSRGLMDAPELLAAITRVGPDAVTATLAPRLTPARKARIEAVLRGRVGSIQVAVEDPQDPHNAAAVVRTAEALGAGAVHMIGGSPRALQHRKVTRGTFYWADTHEHADIEGLAAVLPPGMRIAGACVDGPTMSLADVPVDRPLCLLFGSEQSGLSAAARARCDLQFRVPMFGMAESLNLSVAAGIVLHALLERRRAHLGAPGDLDEQELAVRRARWYAKAVDPRLARHALGLGETTKEHES
ncbi:MAG TPA: RNA methyltransferase [Nannocystis sp.]